MFASSSASSSVEIGSMQNRICEKADPMRGPLPNRELQALFDKKIVLKNGLMQHKQPGLEVRESFKVILQEASTREECGCFVQWVVGGGGVNQMARVNAKVNRDGKTVSTSW